MDGYCEYCKKETKIEVIDSKPGFESVGLEGNYELECQECGTRFWI